MKAELRARLDAAGPSGRLFPVVLAIWILAVLSPTLGYAQDAVPTLVAGDLVRSDPDAIYSDGIYELSPPFFEATCTYVGSDRSKCEREAVAFLSAPLLLPVAEVLARLPADVGVGVLRLVTALAHAGGMAVLWWRTVGRDPRLAPAFLVAAVALTPYVLTSITLGTSSALLFASASLGLAGTDRGRRAFGVGALWMANVLLRGLPAVLAVVLVWRRRWLVLAAAAGVAAVLAAWWLATAPASLLGDFLDSTAAVADEAPRHAYNLSLDAVLDRLGASVDSAADPLPLALRLVVLAGGAVALVRMRTLDAQWAYASLLAVTLAPLVWLHYLGLALPAYSAALAERVGAESVGRGATSTTSSFALGLPVLAVALSWLTWSGSTGYGLSIARFVLLLVAVAVVPVVAGVGRRATTPVAG